MENVTEADLNVIKRNFQWVADALKDLVRPSIPKVVIFMGSPSDKEHCEKIAKHAVNLGLKAELRIVSAHKSSAETLRILSEYESSREKVS